MPDTNRLTRRTALTTGLLTATSLLAGCLGTNTHSPTATQESVFRDVSIDGAHLVVHLHPEHDVHRLNLIAPDGTTYTQTNVATGATTSRLRIIDMQPGIAGYDHYTPGQHRLVAVQDDHSETIPIDLTPNFRISDITTDSTEYRQLSYGMVAVTVENTGTGPSWVHAITYRDAPNWTANDPLPGDPGISFISSPEEPEDLLLGPNSQQTYVGTTAPLLFTDQENQSCHGTTEFSVLVGVPIGGPLEQRIRATYRGEPQSATLFGDYTCSEVSITRIEEKSQSRIGRAESL